MQIIDNVINLFYNKNYLWDNPFIINPNYQRVCYQKNNKNTYYHKKYINKKDIYVIKNDEYHAYFKDDKLHREDGPARIDFIDNIEEWFKNGKLHREDGPAIIHSDGTQIWSQNGEKHRIDGPACIFSSGKQLWYKNGKLHREDAPACIFPNGTKEWYKNDKLHRDDGPAIIFYNDNLEFYYEGRKVDEEWLNIYHKLIKKYTLLDVPVRDKWRVREIVLSWYYNPKLQCVKNRLEKECKELYIS